MRISATRSLGFALSLAASACGGGNDSSAVGGPDGGSQPGADGDVVPARGPCSVAVGSQQQATIVFHDADGLPLATAEADQEGVASFDDCVRDGMVTAVFQLAYGGGGGAFRRLMTVQGVDPGDHVNIDRKPRKKQPLDPLTVTIDNASDDVSGGAFEYRAHIGDCETSQVLDDDTGGEVLFEDVTDCLGFDRSNYSIISLALDAEGDPLAFARVDGDDKTSPAVASDGTWVAYDGPGELTVSQLPDGLSSGLVAVNPLIDGVTYHHDQDAIDLDTGEVSLVTAPGAVVDEQRVNLALIYPDSRFSMTQLFVAGDVPASVDASEVALTPISSPVANNLDPTRPLFGWTGGDDEAVLTRTALHWAEGQDQGVWVVVAPGNPGETRVPGLPDSLVHHGPGEGALSTVGRILQMDRGISYGEWLSSGLSSSEETASYYLPELQHREGDTAIRAAGSEDT